MIIVQYYCLFSYFITIPILWYDFHIADAADVVNKISEDANLPETMKKDVLILTILITWLASPIVLIYQVKGLIWRKND